MFEYLVHPSGGLRYHLRALRHRRHLWSSFHQEIRHWLREWPANFSKPLILVGSSAGYALEESFLKRFPSLIIVEPDPIGRYLFQKRFRHLNFHFLDQPLFLDFPSFRTTHQVFNNLPTEASVLFSNILGQLHLSQSSEETIFFEDALKKTLQKSIRNRAWASFHDRYSVQWTKRNGSGVIEVQDHLDLSSLGTQPPAYFLWPISPSQVHLIQAIAVSPRFD